MASKEAVEAASAKLGDETARSDVQHIVDNCDVLLDGKRRADELLEEVLNLRTRFAAIDAGEQRRRLLRSYLRTTSELIDLTGRMRYLLVDVLDTASSALATRPDMRRKLVDLAVQHKSEVGALVMARLLFDPPRRTDSRITPARESTKLKILALIADTQQADLVDTVARFVCSDQATPALTFAAAETLRAIGLPQDARPGQDPELPQPAITAGELAQILRAIDPSRLEESTASRRAELLAWLDERYKQGIAGDSYQLGNAELQPGDWLLMRNPSPYNLFTDLSPGLFTHVGVVALETGSDGRRRMVVVDLPEQGTQMPATNVEVFVQRTLNYIFLRHPEPAVARRMGRVAATLIGNPTQFDLNFRTARIKELKGKPLEGKKIHAYCAGLLLLCTQETTAKRDEFFPIPEYPARGKTLANVGKLGLSVGEDFVSPTGALFSPKLQIVGRRAPMYDPGREIEEAIFDHFAQSLEKKTLAPTNTLYQSLRTKLAQAAEITPLLGRALAKAAGVDEDTDLVTAAKAAAVVETLDEIAYTASDEFQAARDAIRAGPLSELARQGFTAEDLDQIRTLRHRHNDLYTPWQRRTLSPRELRIRLVDYYTRWGRAEIDERFFSGAE